MLKEIKPILSAAADLIFPVVCPACRQHPASGQGFLCDDCRVELLTQISITYCPRCGNTLGKNVPAPLAGCGLCPNPLPRFDTIIRLGEYASPTRDLIRRLKHFPSSSYVGILADMLAASITARGVEFDCILSVPMHLRRRLLRGSNHVDPLAAALAKRLKLPLDPSLVRIRNTPPQVHLPRTERLKNVKNAFAVRRAKHLENKTILLLDDVTTTGATADECVRTLRRAGVAAVHFAVLAKTVHPSQKEKEEES